MAIKIQIKAGRKCWLASVMHDLELTADIDGDNQNLNQSLEAVPACICHACDKTF